MKRSRMLKFIESHIVLMRSTPNKVDSSYMAEVLLSCLENKGMLPPEIEKYSNMDRENKWFNEWEHEDDTDS